MPCIRTSGLLHDHSAAARFLIRLNCACDALDLCTQHSGRRGTTTSRERLINIFMSVFVYIFTFIQKTSSKSKSSVLTDCNVLDSENILSESRIVGALEGTRLELGVRLVTLQLYTYWYNTAVQNFKNYRCWSVERRQVP